jgi:hypothetical protein
VCVGVKCRRVYEVRGQKAYYFPVKCHDPSYLTNVQKEILDNPKLLSCGSINSSGSCFKCGCSYKKHMHIYYESEEVEKKEVDIVVLAKIKTKEDAKREAEKKVQDLEKRREALKGEEKVITKNSVKFAIFLKSNAIAAYNDSFESYLEYLIENHKILVKEGSKNKNIIKGLEEMLAAYKKEKNIHEQMMKCEAVSFDMAADEIFKLKDELYSLPMYGKKIA